MNTKKKIKINKIALSLATAFLMVSTIVSTITSAAASTNKFDITADKTTCQPGETINLSIGLDPDEQGVAGFTIDLYYDSSKVSVISENTNYSNSKFSVASNYNYKENAVRIVGVNPDSSDISEMTNIINASFKVKDNAKGNINYWLDVSTVSRTDGNGGYEFAPYSAPSKSSPFVVTAPGNDTATTVQTTTASKATTKAVTTTVTSKQEETTAQTTQKTTVSSTAPKATEMTTSSENTSVTSADESSSSPQTSRSESKKPDVSTTIKKENTKPLFTYDQGEQDFNSETVLQYGFSISDYITDYSTKYDVKVNIKTTGNVSGSVGTMNNGTWDREDHKATAGSETVWTYNDLDPNISNGQVFVQLYYLKANSDFQVTSVEMTPVNDDKNTTATTTTQTTSSTANTVSSTSTGTSIESEKVGAYSVTGANSSSTSADKILADAQSKTVSQKSSANKNANPNTGSDTTAGKLIMNILTVAAFAEIAFSIFAFAYNKLNRKEK